MDFRDQATKDTSALIARLFTESAENSRQRLAAFRTAINNATKALETAIGSAPHFERDVSDLVSRLAKTASADAEAAAERVAAEARVAAERAATEARAAAEAVRAELKAETKLKETLAATLKDANAKLDDLQSEIQAERDRSDAIRRELAEAHAALNASEGERLDAVAAREKELKTRATLEAELQRLRQAVDTLRAEAASTSDQLEAAIADRARLEETVASAQSQLEATEAKLAGITTLFKQSSAKLKTLEKEGEAALRDAEASHATIIREMEATHAATTRDMEASRHAAIDEALQAAERNHEAAMRDLEAVHTAALREIAAKHEVALHQLEAEQVAAQHELESRHLASQRELEAQIHASASAGAASADGLVARVDELLEAFQALGSAASVADVLATLVEHLAAEFSRVALFHVRGNRLEGSNQIGFEFDNDIAKLVFPLGLDSLLTRAVVSGRIERVAGDELADSGLAPFGGAPTCALAMPVVAQGETLAIVYADDSGRAASEMSTRFASALLQHAGALLMRLTNELRLLAELRGYAASLLAEVEEMYAADVAGGKSGEDLQHRLKNNIDFARSIYATRIEAEGLEAAPLFEEQLASMIDAQAETRFGRDLASVVGRDETHRKAEAS